MTTDSADRAEWLKQPEAEARRGRQTTKSGRTAANNRTARPQTGGLFDFLKFLFSRWFR